MVLLFAIEANNFVVGSSGGRRGRESRAVLEPMPFLPTNITSAWGQLIAPFFELASLPEEGNKT